MYNPKVSIVIPVYNGANYLGEAIDSALNQTYKNIEVLVINDGSKDNTDEIAKSYGDRIRYFSKQNGGVSSALNLGIKEMKGEYFSWLSHDDKYEPQKIENQIELLSKYNDEKLIAICATKYIDKNSCDLQHYKKTTYEFDRVYNWDEVLIQLFEKVCFNGCALLIPKKAFLDAGDFNEDLRYSQDFLMWIKIFLKEYKVVFGDFIGVCSRVHEKQQTQTNRKTFYADSIVIGNLLIDDLTKRSTKDKKFLYLFAKENAKHKNITVVDNCIKSAKEFHLFTFMDIIKLRIMSIWGMVRPLVRRIYFKLFRNIKTQ